MARIAAACAHPDENAGSLFQIAAEILPAHGIFLVVHGKSHGVCRFPGQRAEARVVYHGGRPVEPLHLCLRAVGGRRFFRHAAESGFQLRSRLRGKGTHGSLQVCLLGNHVPGVPGMDVGNAEHARRKGIQRPADQRLQIHHQRRLNDDGVNAFMGLRAMGSASRQRNGEAVHRRHDGAFLNGDDRALEAIASGNLHDETPKEKIDMALYTIYAENIRISSLHIRYTLNE